MHRNPWSTLGMLGPTPSATPPIIPPIIILSVAGRIRATVLSATPAFSWTAAGFDPYTLHAASIRLRRTGSPPPSSTLTTAPTVPPLALVGLLDPG